MKSTHSVPYAAVVAAFVCFLYLSTLASRVGSDQQSGSRLNDADDPNEQDAGRSTVRWCAIGEAEMRKCEDFAEAVRLHSGSFQMRLRCLLVLSKDQCLRKLDVNEADLVMLDPGEVFIGGRYHSLVPIMTEKYGPGETSYYAVAVVNRTSPIQSAEGLRGRRICFPGVGQMAGWVFPLANLIKMRIMPITDCNNHLKSAADFFGESCAPNALVDKNNPTGDNPMKLCARCGTDHDTKCLDSDTFAGFGGAFRCMLGSRGDVAFVKHTTVVEMTKNPRLGVNPEHYELVCPGGNRRAALNEYQRCNWGQVPAHAIVTSSETLLEKRLQFQQFVKMAVNLFGSTGGAFPQFSGPPRPGFPNVGVPQPQPGQLDRKEFRLFESTERYGNNYNLMFQDATTTIEPIEEGRQTFKDYLGKLEDVVLELRQCPIESVKLCIVSDVELVKCSRMKTAMRAQFLKPDLSCFRGRSQRDCMASVATGNADLTILDAGDVYTAGKEFGLIPILAEQYDLAGPYFYAVAVARIEDSDTDLLFVRGKYSCHPAMGSGAGWVMPISFLAKNRRLRDWGCDGTRSAAEFFQKSCVPGVMSNEYNRGWKQNSQCDLCHGQSDAFCRRDHGEDFYGYTGAFRCLVEGGGNVAFVKHTTVMENANGNNRMWWSRNLLSADFELLCRDGSRKSLPEYESCNLGQVPGNAVVARRDNETVTSYFVKLFLYAQQYYGSKTEEAGDFKFQLFRSEFPYSDVIFQDATQQLVPVPYEQRNYLDYLGFDFVYAKQAIDCSAGAEFVGASLVGVGIAALLSVLVF